MHQPLLEIERRFNEFIRSIGGNLVSELIETDSPEYDNADYLFDSENIISELKVIQKNHESDTNITNKIQAKFDSWVEAGEISGIGYGMVTINSGTLTDTQQWEIARIHNEPIRRTIKKANKQIRDTKVALNRPDAKGLLILINEADRSMPPEHLTFAVHQSLQQDFSNIQNVVVLTVNLIGRLPNSPTNVLLWIEYDRDHPNSITPAFLDDLQQKWISFLNQSSIEPIPLIKHIKLDHLKSMKYN